MKAPGHFSPLRGGALPHSRVPSPTEISQISSVRSFRLGRADAEVIFDVFIPRHNLVNKKLHSMVMIIHQSQNADCFGLDIQVFQHVGWLRERKAGRIDPPGQFLDIEFLTAGIISRKGLFCRLLRNSFLQKITPGTALMKLQASILSARLCSVH